MSNATKLTCAHIGGGVFETPNSEGAGVWAGHLRKAALENHAILLR